MNSAQAASVLASGASGFLIMLKAECAEFNPEEATAAAQASRIAAVTEDEARAVPSDPRSWAAPVAEAIPAEARSSRSEIVTRVMDARCDAVGAAAPRAIL